MNTAKFYTAPCFIITQLVNDNGERLVMYGYNIVRSWSWRTKPTIRSTGRSKYQKNVLFNFFWLYRHNLRISCEEPRSIQATINETVLHFFWLAESDYSIANVCMFIHHYTSSSRGLVWKNDCTNGVFPRWCKQHFIGSFGGVHG